MGGKKRGGPRQKKRADIISQKLTEIHADDYETSKSKSKTDDELFVVDTTPSSSQTNPFRASRKERALGLVDEHGNVKKKSKEEKYGLSEKDKKQVSQIIANQNGDALKVKQLAEESKLRWGGRKAVDRAKKNQQEFDSMTCYDLWGVVANGGSNGDGLNNKKKRKKKKELLQPVLRSDTQIAGLKSCDLLPQSEARRLLQEQRDKRTVAKLTSKTTKKRIAVDVPQGGQSYHPDEEQHQDTLGEALALELRRKEAKEEQAGLGGVYAGMSEETLAVLIRGDDDDDASDSASDDDDEEVEEEDGEGEDDDGKMGGNGDDDNDGNDAVVSNTTTTSSSSSSASNNNNNFIPQRKVTNKLTRAQRNKQKRHKQLLVQQALRKKQKRFLNTVNETSKMTKEILQETKAQTEKRTLLEKLRTEKQLQPLGIDLVSTLSRKDPIHVASLPVALNCELDKFGSSLRQIKPKGNLVKERMDSWNARQLSCMKLKIDRKKAKRIGGKRRKLTIDKALREFDF